MAQVLSTIMVTMSFSSGMPCFYAVPIVGFTMIFFIDKWLLITYYRKENAFTHHLTAAVIKILPLALILHTCFALTIFSKSEIVNSSIKTKSPLQSHIVKYTVVSFLFLISISLEQPIIYLYG